MRTSPLKYEGSRRKRCPRSESGARCVGCSSDIDHPEAETLAAVKELDVQWLNSESVHADRNLTMRLRVTEGGAAAPGARLTFRFARPGATPFYTQTVADSGGAAEIKIEAEEADLPDSTLLVQVNCEGRTATRKFVLRKAE